MTEQQIKELRALIRSALDDIESNDEIFGNEELVDKANITLNRALALIDGE